MPVILRSDHVEDYPGNHLDERKSINEHIRIVAVALLSLLSKRTLFSL
jgi:hypothetical protein